MPCEMPCGNSWPESGLRPTTPWPFRVLRYGWYSGARSRQRRQRLVIHVMMSWLGTYFAELWLEEPAVFELQELRGAYLSEDRLGLLWIDQIIVGGSDIQDLSSDCVELNILPSYILPEYLGRSDRLCWVVLGVVQWLYLTAISL